MLTREHYDAVAAAIPPGVEVPQDFWRGLNMAVVIYSAQQERRVNKPPWRERQRWQRIEKLADALAHEVRNTRLHVSADHDDPSWPNRALRALWAVKYRAESSRIGNEILGHGYGARRQPHRDLFYKAILDLWQTHLGQELGISRSGTNAPGGPLIRFFDACVGPILGHDAPTPESIASIINRVGQRRHGVLKPKK